MAGCFANQDEPKPDAVEKLLLKNRAFGTE
jgi:hypothetical protein